MREMQIKSTINDVDDKEDHDQLVNEDENSLGNVLIEGKINNFKIKIIKQFYYFEEHFIINIFLKLFFGVIMLAFPFICIIIFNIINFSEKSNFFFFPYFITLSLMIGFLMILLVIKIGENCQMNGIIIYTWERKNIFKIINSIIIGFYLLWFTFICEKFTNVYNLLKEKVAQSSNKETSTQLFNRGSYTLRILFILFFWDTEKDNDKEYIHKYLDYFEYEESVLSEFQSYIQSLILPIIFISFHYIFKIIFFKSRKEFLFFILNIIVVFQSFFIIFYPIEKKEDDNALKDEYFSNVGCKYIELIAYLLIILILIISFDKKLDEISDINDEKPGPESQLELDNLYNKLGNYINYENELNLFQMNISIKDEVKDSLFDLIQNAIQLDVDFLKMKNGDLPTIKELLNKSSTWCCTCGELNNNLGKIICNNCSKYRPLETYINIIFNPMFVTKIEKKEFNMRRKHESKVYQSLMKRNKDNNKEIYFYEIEISRFNKWRCFVSNDLSEK